MTVKVCTKNGTLYTYALLDTGSEESFITKAVADKLRRFHRIAGAHPAAQTLERVDTICTRALVHKQRFLATMLIAILSVSKEIIVIFEV